MSFEFWALLGFSGVLGLELSVGVLGKRGGFMGAG